MYLITCTDIDVANIWILSTTDMALGGLKLHS